MRNVLLCAALCVAASACVMKPNHGDHVGSKSQPILFELAATKPNANLSITCSHHYGSPTVVATFTGSSQAVTYANETVYLKNRSQVLPASCWEPWSGPDYSYITYVRVKQGSDNAVVFDSDGYDCLFDKMFDDLLGPITAGFQCKYEEADILLFANP